MDLEEWDDTHLGDYSIDDYLVESQMYPSVDMEYANSTENAFPSFGKNPLAYFFGAFTEEKKHQQQQQRHHKQGTATISSGASQKLSIKKEEEDVSHRLSAPQIRWKEFCPSSSFSSSPSSVVPQTVEWVGGGAVPQHILDAKLNLHIDTQPPREVRTRTPNEIRTFGVSVKVLGDFKALQATIMKVALEYQPTGKEKMEAVGKDILGGTKTVPVGSDGSAIFENLTIAETSTKHHERDFCLRFTLLRIDGQELISALSKPFYAYSHKKVLQRRGCVRLRTLNKSWGRTSGQEPMHVIGLPFIQGPSLAIIFRTSFGEICITDLEMYSESVLFFTSPALNLPPGVVLPRNARVPATIMVTNDGRNFSNQLDFTFISDM